jgi:myo-inositol 2-dehydrogenase/D-chiro-inositol 1-dehydrogenase
MSAVLPIGIVGCGRIAERAYLPALARIGAARLAAVADPRAERRELVAGKVPGCAAYDSLDALLKGGQVAALVVATPAATHAEVAARALDAGLPVLVEKPLARSVSDIAELAARVAGSREPALMMAFNRRFWEPIRRMRGALQAAAAHPTGSARLVMTGDIRSWASIEERSDVLCDLATHQFDLLRFLFRSEIASVRARWIDSRTIRIDAQLDGGTEASCIASHAGRPQETIRVSVAAAAFEVHRGSERIAPVEGAARGALDVLASVGRRLRRRPSSLRRSFDLQLEHFVSCVRAGDAPEPSFADGLAALRAVDAARASAADDGREVPVAR